MPKLSVEEGFEKRGLLNVSIKVNIIEVGKEDLSPLHGRLRLKRQRG